MMKLNDQALTIFRFLQQIEQLKSTLRHNWTKMGRQESVPEHVWRLAMLLVLLHNKLDKPFDLEKALLIVLVHDLPEMFEGDVPGFKKQANDQLREKTQNKEAMYADKLFKILDEPTRLILMEVYTEYETLSSYEACLVKALDKIETLVQHIDSGVSYWTPDEIGDHMFLYAKPHVDRLNDSFLNSLHDLVIDEIRRMHNEL